MATAKEILLENKRQFEKHLSKHVEELEHLHLDIITIQSQKEEIESTIENIDQALLHLKEGE